MKRLIVCLVVGVLLMSTYAFAQDTTIHSYGLTVNGTLESTDGGVIFPDGSIQTTECTTALCDLYGLTGNPKPDFCFQCSDGIDNDGDGLVDYPSDPECISATDNSELQGPQNKIVFITSTAYSGNLGGITGADNICQSHAQSAGLTGTFKAWISSGAGTDPATRFVYSTVPYELTNGNVIANDWNDLIDGLLLFPIQYDEYGSVNPGDSVWTNTFQNGTIKNSNGNGSCLFWTSSSSSDLAYIGRPYSTSVTWTNDSSPYACHLGRYIYCFEQ